MGHPVVHDMTMAISDFLYQVVSEWPEDLELEVKLGWIMDQGQRLGPSNTLGVATEGIVSDFTGKHFNSEVHPSAWLLLKTTLESMASSSSSRSNGLVALGKTHIRDLFYGSGANKTRVSESNGESVCIVKSRKGNMNIVLPTKACDIRLSANVESREELPPPGSPVVRERSKDRWSFEWEKLWRVDMTRVVAVGGHDNLRETHEVEIELIDIAPLKEQVDKARAGQDNNLVDYAASLLNNARAVAGIMTAPSR